MKQIGLLAAVVVCATLVLPRLAAAQTATAIPPSITTPNKVESSIGTLEYTILDDECNVLANHYDLADRHGLDRHQRKGVDALIVQRMPGCSNSDCDLSLSVIPFPPPRSFLSVWFRAQRAPA